MRRVGAAVRAFLRSGLAQTWLGATVAMIVADATIGPPAGLLIIGGWLVAVAVWLLAWRQGFRQGVKLAQTVYAEEIAIGSRVVAERLIRERAAQSARDN